MGEAVILISRGAEVIFDAASYNLICVKIR